MTSLLPDRPLSSGDEDLLGRRLFADGLSDLIINAPPDATLRLGVYGDWGEGKTSVLAMMHKRLAAAGHVCVWLTPWLAATEHEFVDYFINSVADVLGIDRQKLKLSRAASRVTDRLRQFGRAASRYYSLVDLLAGSSIQTAVDKYAERRKTELQRQIDAALGGRRLIVLVDDLDRVRPDLLPRMLLTLREVLDQPNLFYVMALAPEVVERGLESVHQGWGSTAEFLDKIIEFPAYLPAPKPEDLKRFVEAQLQRLGTSIDPTPVARLSDLLPTNPRRLKLFLRFLASLHPLIARFAADELDWRTFYLIQLFKIEFPREGRALIQDGEAVASIQNSFVEDYIAEQYKQTEKRRPEQQHAPEGPSKERFIAICEGLRRREAVAPLGDYSFSDLLAMPEDVPAVTIGEALALVKDLGSAEPRLMPRMLASFLEVSVGSPGRRAGDLWKALLRVRGRELRMAAHVEGQDAVIAGVHQADLLLRILRSLITEVAVFQKGYLDGNHWFDMLRQFAEWAHFHKVSYYDEARRAERQLMLDSINALPGEAAETLLNPMLLHGRPSHREPTPEFDEAVREVFGRVDLIVSAWTIDTRLATEGGMDRPWSGRGQDEGSKYVLFNPNSALFNESGLRDRVRELARGAIDRPAIQENFLDYFGWLVFAAFEGSSVISQVGCREIVKDSEWMAMLWCAAVAHPLNPRSAGTLRKERDQLVKSGIPEELLPEPVWWGELEAAGFFEPSD